MRLQQLKTYFAIAEDNPQLVLAQLGAFSRQIPLLYCILLANMAFVSATHWSVAPLWLVAGIPALFTGLAATRIFGWLRMRQAMFSPTQAHKKLRSTVILSAVFGLMLTAWSFAMLQYGSALHHGHIAFFMAATLVACVFCLMHLRPAAIVLALIVAVPFCIQFMLMPEPIAWAIAANFAIVCGVILYIVSANYDDFATMVAQRTDLERRNAEMKKLSDENFRLANLDALTGLPNRRSFIAEIRTKVETSCITGKPFAVGIIDLDGFKAVNDLYGHSVGDALLVEASNRLISLSDNQVFFARLGGDEFGFIAEPIHTLGVLGRTIIEILNEPFSHEGVLTEISASCGISLFPANCETTSELMEYADYALYQAKNEARGTAVIFNSGHRDQLRIAHLVDQTLRNSNLDDEMRLAYQPVVDTITGQTVMVEALARWSSESLGQMSPSKFIAVAERSPLINRVTQVLIKRMLSDMTAMPSRLRVSFNLSSKSLCCAQSMLQVLSAIQRSGVDPRRLEIEVTESALMANFDTAKRSMELLRNLGCTIALDDFGTGYSSLSYVHELPLDKLKIDSKFVETAGQDKKARKVIKTIVSLSHDLNIGCVAEGVETAEHAAVLRDLGCHLMQGFHFARPMPLCDLLTQVSISKAPRSQVTR